MKDALSNKFQKGFTLIELLIVIAIIGILASIVMVSLSSAKSKSYRASALSTVAGLGSEFTFCNNDNLFVYMPADSATGAGRVCRDATPADVAEHTIDWPTLSETGGYCYDDDNDNTNGCGMADNDTDLPNTFYLTSAANISIQCDWGADSSLVCQ